MHRQTLGAADWIVLVAYALVLVMIAVYHSRRMKTQDDIFLAGRSMSRWPIALSMYMALFSTNSFVGVTGWVNRDGGTIWIGLQNIGIILAVPFVVYLFPTLFYRLRISTAYEYLEKRFSYPVRVLANLLFLGARLTWLATMVYSASLVISTMVGWTPDLGYANGVVPAIILIGLLGTFCAVAGGMRAVIWTDVVQFFVLMGGVVTMVIVALGRLGGPVEVITIAANQGKLDPPSFFNITEELTVVSCLLMGFINMLSSSGADQVVLQTYLTAKSDVEAKRSLWRNGLVLKPMSLIFPVLGVVIFAYYRVHPEIAQLMRVPDDALPVFVVDVLPPVARGLMVAAIMAAVLTSVESGMAALSAAVQVDYVQRWRARPLSDRQALLLGRLLMVFWGAVVLFAALFIRHLGTSNSIIQILNIVMSPFAGVLLGIFLLGLLSLRANSRGTLIGASLGFAVTVFIPLCRLILTRPGFVSEDGFFALVLPLTRVSSFYYGVLGTVVTLVLGFSASLLFAEPVAAKLSGLTRRGSLREMANEPGPTPVGLTEEVVERKG